MTGSKPRSKFFALRTPLGGSEVEWLTRAVQVAMDDPSILGGKGDRLLRGTQSRHHESYDPRPRGLHHRFLPLFFATAPHTAEGRFFSSALAIFSIRSFHA
jgi:hypothetical protein